MVRYARRLLIVLFSLAGLLVFGWLGSWQKVYSASSDDAQNFNYVRRDPEDYNYLPLILNPDGSTGGTGVLRDIISYNMAFDQGYEVQCAKPDWNITPQVYGALREYFEFYSAPVTLGGGATYNIDFSGGRIPLFRGDEDLADTTKISSFDGYFGANYQKNQPAELNSTGVTNLLLSSGGQCAAKFNNLRSLFGEGAICSKLSDDSQCALSRDIAGTDFTTEELFDTLSALFTKNNGERNLTCGDIASGWTEGLLEFGIDKFQYEQDVAPATEAVGIMPLSLDVLYRLAFLVIAPQQNIASGDDIFQFLQNLSPLPDQVDHSTINDQVHAPIVIGFKVPFVATNSIFSLPSLRDSTILTADLARELNQIEELKSTAIEDRLKFVETIIDRKQTKPLIDCEGLPQCSGGDTSQAMFQALIDLVNGSNNESGKPLSCKAFKGPYEYAGDLGSPAEASVDKNFNEPFATAQLPITNSAGFNWTLEVRDENVQSRLGDETVPVSAYLITPYGTDLTYLQNSLQGVFFSDTAFLAGELTEWEKLVQNNCIPDFNGECGMVPEYFTFGAITADLDSDSDSFSFIYGDQAGCQNITNPEAKAICEAQLENEPTKSFGATLGEQPREPLRILGAKLGWLIKQIQLKLREASSKTYEYIDACVRTEDMFLGRCLGFLGEPGGKDSNLANSCSDYSGIEVELPKDLTAFGDLICSVAHNNPLDVQLLWGLSQIEGHIMNDFIYEGRGSVSCSELIVSDCGSSVVGPGLIVPQCVNLEGCPRVAWAVDDSAAAQAYQDSLPPEVVCSVRGTLEWVLTERKKQTSYLKALYRERWGTDPSTKQLYYMMAGKNYGLPEEYLVQPACEGAPAVSGCGELNYCQCAIDGFTYQCGQRV